MLGQLARFALIGGAATLIHLLVGVTLIHAGWAPVIANAAAFCIAFFVSFAGHFGYTFCPEGPSMARSLTRFAVTALAAFVANEAILAALLARHALPPSAALVTSTGVVACGSFALCRAWAFAPSRPDAIPSGGLWGRAFGLWAMRPTIPGLLLVIVANIWMLAMFSTSFWQRAYDLFGDRPALLALFGIGIWAFTMIYVLVFTNRWLLKPFLIANILIAAGASYYHENMGIIIDREMIQNILGTTANESRSLFTAAYLEYMAADALLPSLLIAMVRVSHPPFGVAVRRHLGLLSVCVLIFGGAAYSQYQVFSFGVKQSPGMRQILHPESTVQSLLQYAQMKWRARSLEFTRIGLDAQKGPALRRAMRPVLAVLVIGETLSDQNWGLSGYARDTAPELAQRDILPIAGVQSCGTSTAISIPCMFSRYPRQEFTPEAAGAQENLLDVLKRAGYDVEWMDGNTGDMGVAARIPYQNFNRADDAEFCQGGECNDGILLKKLRARAASITRDTVIVLHQIGNHGPAYFERYPQGFARFLPDCREADLAACAPEEIVNAYDNAAAYTDLQLARTIDWLADSSDLDTALLYVSDHGESLGESGLFLHAAPYWIAPATQKTVPMVVWMSERFQADMQLGYDCADAPGQGAISHDNFFHSVLGMLNVETAERDPTLDIFASCTSAQQIATR
ncbi:sulfatase-like hydrolase/transferase [Roseovarius sp. S1116L3]|uniref:sulfatase-like hydrolase/transferase n=1 Tax=Roseovarius roseus TaxID=3342636 RepID=UPI00372AAAE6